jgi:hypothetical protein
MQKFIFILLLFLSATTAKSQTLNGMTDAQQLGAMAGLALACNAGSKLDDFQLISSYIIANENPTETKRKKAFKAFAAEKLRTYNRQKDNPMEDCAEILERFYNIPIFNCTVYRNGDVRFPDGKLLKAPSEKQKKKALAKEKRKANEPKRNYVIPARNRYNY